MDINVATALVWFLAVTSGLMSGVYLAFSSFVLRSFDALDPRSAIAAMNAINTHILRSLFMPLFFGSTLAAVLLVGAGFWHWRNPDAEIAVAAGMVYAIGMFGVTAAFNVPLNNQLAAQQRDDSEAKERWQSYRTHWGRWNTVRTIASLLGLVLSVQIIS